MNLPNSTDKRSMVVIPTRLHFDDFVVSHDSKKWKCTDTNFPIGTVEVSSEDSGISVLGMFATMFQLYSDNLKLIPVLLLVE